MIPFLPDPDMHNSWQDYARQLNAVLAEQLAFSLSADVVVSDIQPGNPKPGTLWFDQSAGQLKYYRDNGVSLAWLTIGP